jgi:hypothetical protein
MSSQTVPVPTSRLLVSAVAGAVAAFNFGLIAWYVLPASLEGIATVPSPDASPAVLIATIGSWIFAPLLAWARPQLVADTSAMTLGVLIALAFTAVLVVATQVGGGGLGGVVHLLASLGVCLVYGLTFALNLRAFGAHS